MGTTTRATPAASAAAWIARSCTLRNEEYAGLTKASFVNAGTISRNSAIRLPQISGTGVHGDAGDVAAGMGEALDQTLADEVGRKHHDRNRGRQALKERPADAVDEDDVRLAGDHLRRQRFETRRVFLLRRRSPA